MDAIPCSSSTVNQTEQCSNGEMDKCRDWETADGFCGLMSRSGRLAHLIIFGEGNRSLTEVEIGRIREVGSRKLSPGILGFHAETAYNSNHFHAVYSCQCHAPNYCKCHIRTRFAECSAFHNGHEPGQTKISIRSRIGHFGLRRGHFTKLLSYLSSEQRNVEQVNFEGRNRYEDFKNIRCDGEEDDQRLNEDISKLFTPCGEELRDDEIHTLAFQSDSLNDRKRKNDEERTEKRKGRVWGVEAVIQALKAVIEEKRLKASDLEFDQTATTILTDSGFLLDTSKKKELFLEAEKLAFNDWNPLPFHEKVIELSKTPYSFTGKKFYSIQYSLYVILALLKTQFHTYDNVKLFIETINLWANCLIAKKNCLYIIGPTNCGKSFFAQTIEGIMWNVGYMGNMNRNQGTFWADNCINRALISFEEGNLSGDDNFINDFKKLSEGSECNVNRKYKGSITISKTPLLITTNHEIAQYCTKDRAIIESRLIRYHFNHCRELKNCIGSPHPLVWQKLLTLTEIDWALNPEWCNLNDFEEPDISSYDNQSKWFRAEKKFVMPNNLSNIFNEINKMNNII